MVYIFLADGCEEIEALAPLDILRRGGVEVKTVGVTGMKIHGAHGINIEADIDFNMVDASLADAVFLPGGGVGSDNLYESFDVRDITEQVYNNGNIVAAICAAPKVLGRMGLLKGKKATCYPGFEDELLGAEIVGESVVTSDNVITANGMGAAFKLGFELLRNLKGEETAQRVKNEIQYR